MHLKTTEFTLVELEIKQEPDEQIDDIGDWNEISSEIKAKPTDIFMKETEVEEEFIDAFDSDEVNKTNDEIIEENLENIDKQDPLRDALKNERYDRNKPKHCKMLFHEVIHFTFVIT